MSTEVLIPLAVGVAVIVYTMWRRNSQNGSSTRKALKSKSGLTIDKQSVLVEGTTDVYCSPLLPNGQYVEPFDPRAQSLYDVFKIGMEKAHDGSCVGWRPRRDADYVWRTYSTLLKQATDFGSGLMDMENVHKGSFIGIYARNRPEWLTAALGCVTQSLVIVPLYDTLGAEAAAYIVNQAEIPVVVCDDENKMRTLLKAPREQISTLKHIVVIDEGSTKISKELTDMTTELGIEVSVFTDEIRHGAEHPHDLNLPSADDLYIICYTSGTTGNPKGVMLTHANLIRNLSCMNVLEDEFGFKVIGTGEAVISYLPLAHMFEQMVHWLTISAGGKIGYFNGDIKGLTSDMKALKPVFFPVVPRLLNRLYDKINGGLENAGWLKNKLFSIAYNSKLSLLKQGIVTKDTIWDRFLFSKLQAELGGNVRVLVTGSAPISNEVLEMCRVALGTYIMEGYGQTECTALATNTWPTDCTGGHVGGVAPVAQIKLMDVPELNAYAKHGKGEVCLRGPSMTKGYFKDPEKTAELIDTDGWLHTGDVGEWLKNGTIKIIDRKKHIFKLAQGEYVAPEKIEIVYSRSPYVAQVFVEGSSFERYLVAIVVPDEQMLSEWYEHKTKSKKTFAEICGTKEALEFMMLELKNIGRANKLNSMEQVKAIKLISDPFSVENGLLTPTLKAKRPALRKYFADDITELYKSTNE